MVSVILGSSTAVHILTSSWFISESLVTYLETYFLRKGEGRRSRSLVFKCTYMRASPHFVKVDFERRTLRNFHSLPSWYIAVQEIKLLVALTKKKKKKQYWALLQLNNSASQLALGTNFFWQIQSILNLGRITFL